MRLIVVGALVASLCSTSQVKAETVLFPDVYSDDMYREAVSYVYDEEIMRGYADGFFKPDRTLNRAEFAKILVIAAGDSAAVEDCKDAIAKPFPDIPRDAWFRPYVCAAAKQNMIEGNPDGNFYPSAPLNVAEVSTMLARAFDLELAKDEKGEWFTSAIKVLGDKHVFPMTIETPYSPVNRAQVAEMLWRLQKNIVHVPSASADNILSKSCKFVPKEDTVGIDMDEVRRVWFSWMNQTRAEEDQPRIQQRTPLQWTATLWSRRARDSGSMDHKRDGQTSYYDYAMMTDWFSDLGLEFENKHRVTFTENIGWGYYRCTKMDCTADFLKALRTTYDMYLKEKNQVSRPHYNSIVNPQFTIAGVGIALNTSNRKFYVTTHYATSLTSHPVPVCF